MAKYCSQCGNALKEGSLFCSQCGTPTKKQKSKARNTPSDSLTFNAGKSSQSTILTQASTPYNLSPQEQESPAGFLRKGNEEKPEQQQKKKTSRNKTLIIAASVVALLALAAALACFVFARTEDTGDQSIGYAAYNDICEQRIEEHGKPEEIEQDGMKLSSGLCYANLIDLDGNGVDEMVLAWQDPNGDYETGLEVYTYRDYRAAFISTPEGLSQHATNGGISYLEFYKRTGSDGYALSVTTYDSSYPTEKKSQRIYGFSHGECILLAERSQEYSGSSENENYAYYSGHYETAVDESEYNRLFDEFLEEPDSPAIHAHFFTEAGDPIEETVKLNGDTKKTIDCEGTSKATNETLGKLEEYRGTNPPNPGLSDEAREAYLELCREYIGNYGEPSAENQHGQVFGTGLCYTKLIDVNGDEADELAIAWMTPGAPQTGGFEIWSHQNGSLVQLFSGNDVSTHGTNGYFPYIEFFERNDGKGYALAVTKCRGSYPEKYAHFLFGFDESGSTLLAQRSETYDNSQPDRVPTYYEGEWKAQIDENEYLNLFGQYLNDQATPDVHVHLYTMDGTDFDNGTHITPDTSMTMDIRGTLEYTRWTLDELGYYGNQDETTIDSSSMESTAADFVEAWYSDWTFQDGRNVANPQTKPERCIAYIAEGTPLYDEFSDEYTFVAGSGSRFSQSASYSVVAVEASAESQTTCKVAVSFIGIQNNVDQARYEQLMQGPYSQDIWILTFDEDLKITQIERGD
ncbi:MAG: zinc ribbon domain-containing protein [Eggerthellaceae bacterium]